MCLSHNKTIQLIRQLGEGHDNEVKRWLYEVQEVIGNGGSTIESATDMTEDAMTSDSETETEWTSTEASGVNTLRHNYCMQVVSVSS